MIVKLQTDDLAMAAEILLGIKISAIRLNKDDNLPEYNDELSSAGNVRSKTIQFCKAGKIVYRTISFYFLPS